MRNRPRAAAKAGRTAPRSRAEARVPFDRLADLAVLAIVAIALIRLAGMTAGARYVSDECYHAYLSEWIAGHGTLPRQVEGLYGGFKYFYPPLFHLLGALTVRVLGTGALKFLSLALLGALIALGWIRLARTVSPAAGRLGALLLLSFTGLLVQSTRVYVETLTALLAVATLFALLAVVRRPTWRAAVILGVLAGLAEVAKQSGLALIAAIAAMAVVFAWRRESSRAGSFALALAVAIAVASPYWIRNTVLFGSPVYPLFGSDIDARLMQMNRAAFTPGALRLYAMTLQSAGVILPGAILVALGIAAFRRWRSPEDVALWVGAGLLLAAPLVPMFDARHTIPVVACLAVLAAAVIASSLERSPILTWTTQTLAVACTALLVITLPDLRAPLNLSHDIDPAFDAIRREVPKASTILCIETYETFYHTGRGATWPIPYGQKDPPLDVFLDRDPEQLVSHLRRHGIDYMLVPWAYRGEVFTSANFPAPFMHGLERLIQERKVALVWSDRIYLLLHVTGGPASHTAETRAFAAP